MTTVLTSLIPFILIIILPLSFLIWKRKSNFFTVKITHWLLIAYTGVLLISIVFVSFIEIDEPMLEKHQLVDIYAAIYEGDISEEHVLVEKSFTPSSDILKMAVTNPHQVTDVFVKRTGNEDGMVKMLVLGYGPTLKNMNFSKEFNPPNVRLLDENTLIIHYPELQEIKVAVLKNDFTINQFTGNSIFGEGIDFERPIFYMEIPEHLELESNPEIEIHPL